jgi:hypothetical protein
MLKINARDILALTNEQLWSIPEGRFILVFDNGEELETDNRRTIFSAYYWLMHKTYPSLPLLKRHHVGDTQLTPSLHMDMCSKVAWDAYFSMNLDEDTGVEVIEEICKIVYYGITRNLYNDLTYRLEAYVTTVSILDYIEIINHPPIAKANKEVLPNEISIKETYGKITAALDDPELERNNVRRFVKARLAPVDQVLQSIGPRGHVTDIDSNIFPEPILTSYTEGFKDLKDALTESRSGAKALMFTKEPLGKTQYFNRRMQLGCSVIQNLHRTDCGSDQYVPFTVKPGDLNALEGKYYKPPEVAAEQCLDGSNIGYSNTLPNGLRRVTKDDRHLIGQTIKLRSAITCHHPDPVGICSTCLGALSYSVPMGTNIGHVAATELCSQVSQKVLSTKHLDKTSVMEVLSLSDHHKKFLTVSENDGSVYFNRNLRLKGVKINITKDVANHIGDIFSVKDLSQLVLTRVSALNGFYLELPTKDSVTQEAIPTVLGTSPASLSLPMLEYMRTHQWTYDANGDFVIDMSEWDYKQPLLVFPKKHMSMMDFMRKISSIIESADSEKESRSTSRRRDSKIGHKVLMDFDSPSSALEYLHDEVSSKVFVNIAHLEVIIRSTLVRNREAGDYRPPLPGQAFEAAKFRENLQGRSLSAQMAYQDHRQTFMSPASYVNKNRPPHPMDAVFRGHGLEED